MNALKRFLGVVWLLLAGLAAYASIFYLGIPKVTSDLMDDKVFGIIILTVLTPIIVGGLAIFGYYSLSGDYDDTNM